MPRKIRELKADLRLFSGGEVDWARPPRARVSVVDASAYGFRPAKATSRSWTGASSGHGSAAANP